MTRIHRRGHGIEELAVKVLAWVLHAARPLSVAELMEALAVEEWSDKADPENRPDVEDVLECCMGLITIRTDETVHFSHYTAKRYLLTNSMIPSTLYLAKICLTYLLFDNIEDAIEPLPLLQYAAQYWTVHLNEYQQDAEIIEHFKRLVFDRTKFHFMLLARYGSPDEAKPLKISSPLHLTARAGLSFLTALLLEWDPELCLPWRDTEGRTALHEAGTGGTPEIANQLIKWNSRLVNKRDKEGRTPLHYAAKAGRVEIIQILLSNGGDPSKKDIRGLDSLFVALAWREDEAARIIFDHMFKADTATSLKINGYVGIGSQGHTILHQAAHMGYVQAIERLIEAGADPHAVTYDGLTPLVFAAREGHTQCVQILLQAMDNQITPSSFLDTPLHKAAKHGREDTVKVLLEADEPQANIRDFLGYTPLHWAAAGGHAGVVKLLLPKTELLTEEDVPSAWCLASWGGHEDVLQTLWAHDPEHCQPVNYDARYILQQFDKLTRGFGSTDDLDVTSYTGEIEMCCYYGQTQMNRGRSELGSAWLDLAIYRCPGNGSIRNPEDLICSKKQCDSCYQAPIKGPYHACVLCLPQCYDICAPCFQKRKEIGHPHDCFLKIPASSYPLPTFEEHLDRLQKAIEHEIPIGVRTGIAAPLCVNITRNEVRQQRNDCENQGSTGQKM